MKRVNGLSWPWHPLQVSSWLALLLFLASFHLLCLPILLHHQLLPLFLVLCWLLTALLFISAYICCRRDPSIPPSTAAINPLPGADSTKECRWCQAVTTLDTHHCRLCDKCIPGFDHHCLWLNTCIGRSNYAVFFVALVSVCAFLAFQVGVLAYCLEVVSGGSVAWRESVAAVYGLGGGGDGGKVAVQVALAFSLCLQVCALLPVSHLLALHVWLWRQRLTTYAWIVQSRANVASPSAGKKAEAASVKELQMATVAVVEATVEDKQQQQQQQQAMAEVVRQHVAITVVAADDSGQPIPNSVDADSHA